MHGGIRVQRHRDISTSRTWSSPAGCRGVKGGKGKTGAALGGSGGDGAWLVCRSSRCSRRCGTSRCPLRPWRRQLRGRSSHTRRACVFVRKPATQPTYRQYSPAPWTWSQRHLFLRFSLFRFLGRPRHPAHHVVLVRRLQLLLLPFLFLLHSQLLRGAQECPHEADPGRGGHEQRPGPDKRTTLRSI